MKHFAGYVFLKKKILSSLGFILGFFAFSQEIAIGTWRTHFSYNNAQLLEATPDKVFCASMNGFFSMEIENGAIQKLSKIDGLSDVSVSALAYNEDQNVLVIGYRSGFVDFVFEDKIVSISAIVASSLDVDKTINDITFGKSKTYLGTGLGVIVVQTSNAKIVENYVQIGVQGKAEGISELVYKNDSLFIRTSQGMQVGSLTTNLLDFANWFMYGATAHYSNLTLVENEIFALSGSNLMKLTGNIWQDTGADLPTKASRIFGVDGHLMTVGSGIIYSYNGDMFESETTTIATSANDLKIVGDRILMADSTLGLIDESGNSLSPNGPLSDSFSNFRVFSNQLYGFHAPSISTYDGTEQVESFSLFKEGEWQKQTIENFTNVSDIAKFNGNFFYSSIGDGIYDGFNESISVDIPGSASELDTVVTALAGGTRLWASSFGNSTPVHCMDDAQHWISYSNELLKENKYLIIELSETGIAWLGATSGVLTVIDPDENTTDNINDHLPTSFDRTKIEDIDISIEDNAWIGTSRGPLLFSSASFIFLNSDAIQPTNEGRILFQREKITAVMTDGGNRIWFGTNRGLWVYDKNTSELLAVYNESNSPIPSDQIIRLEYNDTNGEVFILTRKGMVSFRSSSSIAKRTHDNVNIFPNPVRPNYQGLVGLTGLARDANIKITDINGNLVKEINANGGSASWNLTNVRGSMISTGIYLFFSSSFDGNETYIGKIAVTR